MDELNQYAISKLIGSRMKPLRHVQFGGFGVLATNAEVLRARESNGPVRGHSAFTYDQDRVIAQAFEDVREGASPDSLLWDRRLTASFGHRCRQLGIAAADAVVNRRLLNIRKNKARYQKHGIVLSPTTRSEPHPSIVSEFAHVVEFALVKVRYRYGASIDEILLDPELSTKYENLALESTPTLSRQDLRLAALYIRKSRFIRADERELIHSLDLSTLEKTWSKAETLDKVNPLKIPDSPGLLELRESNRYLYISRNESLRPAIRQMVEGNPFRIVEGPFWHPHPESITVQFIAGSEIAGMRLQKWEHKLLYDREPVFNWPLHKLSA